VVQGEVHDENAYALGGVAGHAGLFGTARDAVTLGRAALDCLKGESGWFEPEVMRGMIAPRAGGAHRLGWDGRGAQSPSSGERMGPRTFGHLGFTGTSLWCDPDADVAIALVTNRVHPTRENGGIRALRPAIHDAVLEALAARRR
jgi:CubicO group peptidase (beta-lactamase class C family)